MRHIIINLEAPLMAFGGETIDNLGVVRPFPAASMLTGMFANALGWRRTDRQKHQDLQDRLAFAARIEREPAGGLSMQDYQTVKMGDTIDIPLGGWTVGWTTRGEPEKRGGQLGSRGSGPFTHIRYRDYYADMRVTVALRLRDVGDSDAPTLDELAPALEYPKRPLFIGRKPCLPSAPLFGGFGEGETCLAALLNAPLVYPDEAPPNVRMQWHDREGVDSVKASRIQMLTDERNWVSGLHGGGRLAHEGSVDKSHFVMHEASMECDKDGEA
ncbi:MAG: type I-E CRISPR-associated protein Cas5/CasD [Chloroflexi bacterium]|nr:type I-E CRISPR-associated protein Cas5/CasD [Chloroflexota bacterium]